MAAIHHQIWIDAPLATVHAGLATARGLGYWWVAHTASVIDGKTKCFQLPAPNKGSQPRSTAKVFIAMSASQKLAMEAPAMANSMVNWSGQRLRLTAAAMPAESPMVMAMP